MAESVAEFMADHGGFFIMSQLTSSQKYRNLNHMMPRPTVRPRKKFSVFICSYYSKKAR